MGYTHYWRVNESASDEGFAKWALDMQKLLSYANDNGFVIGDGFGEKRGAWAITEGHVSFNGVDDESYETFFVPFEPYEFAFCKTAQRPYDVVVVASLVRLKHHLGDAAQISSDGRFRHSDTGQIVDEIDEDGNAARLYKSVFGEDCDIESTFAVE